MPKETQISAVISQSTKELLERHVRATGTKKGHLIEQALLHHLRALQELPVEFIVPPRLVTTADSGCTVLEQIASGEPTRALRDLMADGD